MGDAKQILTSKHRHDLEVKGYTVVENAVPGYENYQREIKQWMKDSFGEGNAPCTVNSLVRGHRIGHFEPVWKVRLDVKECFAQLWGDDHLLTSVDTVALGQPPEYGQEEFDTPPLHWLHVDQSAARVGLHAYQGGVYLETADEDDWTFEVLEGSHQFIETFYKTHKDKGFRSISRNMYRLQDDDMEWFVNKGCERKRVPAKGGSLLLWDSRLIHANARPIKNRRHPDRWRIVVLVCMAPASWATDHDLDLKRQAYDQLMMTNHWPCDDVAIHHNYSPSSTCNNSMLAPMTSLPPIAKSREVRQLSGVLPYAPRRRTASSESAFVTSPRPTWDFLFRPDMAQTIAGTGPNDSWDMVQTIAGTGRRILRRRIGWFIFLALCIFVISITFWRS